jgi:hypothetical protein
LVIVAFAQPGVLERGFALPEIMPGVEFPGAQAVSFHFIDYVVHGWDVAQRRSVSSTNSTLTWSRLPCRSPRPFPGVKGGDDPAPRSALAFLSRPTPARWSGSSPCSDAQLTGLTPQ